jgi:alanine racemase
MDAAIRHEYVRPTRAEIRLGALKRNFLKVRSLVGPDVKIMAIVKANAFGHGMVPVAARLLESGADYLGVAYIEEALSLRANGITAPLHVMGAAPVDQVPVVFGKDVDLTLSSLEMARAVSGLAVSADIVQKVHLKIDTGMGRLGVDWEEGVTFVESARKLPGLEVVGLFSHLATAGDDLAFAREQIGRFQRIVATLEREGELPPLVHLANSAGLINFPEARFAMVRPGIVLYGYEPSSLHHLGVEPVMRLVSRVASIKDIRSGSSVGYGRTWTACSDTRIATLPLGYGDGYSRRLSNKGEVIIRGARYPIVGLVCMDWLMVDIGKDSPVMVGDEVLMFGEKDGSRMSGELLCERMGGTLSELPTIVSARVPRVFLDE